MAFNGVDGIDPAPDATGAEWVGSALWSWHEGREVGTRVGAVVPPVYAAYARVFHPARASSGVEGPAPVQWQTIADWSGRVAYAEMQFGAIRTPLGPDRGSPPWDHDAPAEGSLHPTQLRELVPLLESFTATPERVQLAIWDGYGFWYPGARTYLYSAPRGVLGRLVAWRRRKALGKERKRPSPILGLSRLVTEGREYVVFSGGFGGIAEVTSSYGWHQSPNLWWPVDRAWCVASEIDLDSTLIGGSQALIDRVVASPDLEALAISPGARLDYLGDRINDPDGSLSRMRGSIE